MLTLLAALWPLTAPADTPELAVTLGPAGATEEMLLRSTTDLTVLGPVVEEWLAVRGDLKVRYEQWGSNALLDVMRADCADPARAGADLVISSAAHHMVEVVNAGCARSHVSEATLALPDDLSWRDQLWGISREPAVIVYNRDLMDPAEVPRSRFDLLDLLRPDTSRFRGRVATYDIEESGLGFLLAFADSQEATTFGSLLEAFGRSGAVATCCSAELIDAVAEGEYLLAYNVLGSYALLRAEDTPSIGIVAPRDYLLTLSRAAMIPRNAPRPGDAAALVDYFLSAEGQRSLEARHLVVAFDDESAALELNGSSDSLLRRIELSPKLLAARDAHKIRLFTDRWRASFPRVDR